MLDLRELQRFWLDHKSAELCLCTIIRKHGSGYRSVGAKKIIQRGGLSYGLLSGGCLEADIVQAAEQGWEELPFVRSFSTLSAEDRILGYQTGCAGVIDILFEALPENVDEMALWLPFGSEVKAEGVAVSLGAGSLAKRCFSTNNVQKPADYFDPWVRPIALSVLGCGPDAAAFLSLARQLGWDLSFYDFRKPSASEIPAQRTHILPIEKIAEALPQGPHTAVVLMTHNYQADLKILERLLDYPFGYIGCLGPAERYAMLSSEMKPKEHNLDARPRPQVFAPAGLLPKQRTPETIALSIVAQIQSILGARNVGGPGN